MTPPSSPYDSTATDSELGSPAPAVSGTAAAATATIISAAGTSRASMCGAAT